MSGLFLSSVSAATLETSRWFEVIKDVKSGVPVHVLKGSAEEHQQVLYYTQDMMTQDGRYLWFTAMLKPGTRQALKVLGLVDLETDTKTIFAEAKFEGESPWVDIRTGDVSYVGLSSLTPEGDFPVYRLAPRPDAKPEVIGHIPRFEKRAPRQVVTHLSMNASRTAFLFDSGNHRDSDKTFYGVMPLNNAPAQTWGQFDRRLDHAQMSPTRDNLMLIAEDNYTNREGKDFGVSNRMWLVYADGRQEPIFPAAQGSSIYHEWWDPSGEYVWYVDQKGTSTGGHPGTAKVRLSDRQVILVWPKANGHSHSSADGFFLVADHKAYRWQETGTVRVTGLDVARQRPVDIVTTMPPPKWEYHTHPHPQFDCNDTCILFTCTLAGYTSVGIVRTADVFGAGR